MGIKRRSKLCKEKGSLNVISIIIYKREFGGILYTFIAAESSRQTKWMKVDCYNLFLVK